MNNEKDAKKKFKLDGVIKGVGIYTIIAAALYITTAALKQNGYMLINTKIEYWLCFAMLVGIFVILARFIMNLPKRDVNKKVVRISSIALCVALIFLSFIYTKNGINDSLKLAATLKSPDGKHTVLLMRSDVALTDDDGATTVYTLYRAMPRRNAVFCDSKATEDFILIRDDKNADIEMQWTETGLILSTQGAAIENCDRITLDFE